MSGSGKIGWCLDQELGLRLVNPSDRLARIYLAKAKDAIRTVSEVSSKEWKVTAAYYSMYFSVYSILAKAGIASKIHSCTIEFARSFLSGSYSRQELELFERAKDARIDSQYYLGKSSSGEDAIVGAPGFVGKSETILQGLGWREIEEIRASFLAVVGNRRG